MICVKFYGLMRLESGVKELQVEAESVKTLFARLEKAGFDRKALRGCYLLVNGEKANAKTKLNDGDVVQLLPPVAGG
ncbi:MAG: MoaD/ThiS family protein [Ruminococcaceae bacterium]|nr:MoaD/ThiS family protein [Oscillospiraceae bacterium]